MTMGNRIQRSRYLAVGGIAIMTLALGGCAGSLARKPSAYPGVSLKELDYEVMETVEGSGEVTTVLCFIRLGAKQFGYTAAGGGSALGLASALASEDAVAAATYDAISKVPQADMLLPLTTTAEYSGLGCLYREERAKVRGKAIRILE
ncbi:MAG: hypothetical protein ACX98W_11155 [bacterium]